MPFGKETEMNKTILLAATLVSGAIVFHAASSRYEMAVRSDNAMFRLDRLTGRVDACVPSRCVEFTRPLASGMTLEERYPGIADTIKAARAYGHSDEEIQRWITRQVERGRAAGMDQQAIDKWLAEGPPSTTPKQGGDIFDLITPETPSQSSR